MSEWIAIQEQLPEYDINVLTYRGKYEQMQVDSLISDVEEIAWCGTICKNWEGVSHWMPLPEGPDETKKH